MRGTFTLSADIWTVHDFHVHSERENRRLVSDFECTYFYTIKLKHPMEEQEGKNR